MADQADGKQRQRLPPPSEIAAAVPFVGFYLYGVGWLFYDQVFGQVHVSAEAAGITFDYLAVRSIALLGALIALIFIGTGFYHRRARLADQGYDDVQTVVAIGILVLSIISGAMMVFGSRLIISHALGWPEPWPDLIAAAMGLLSAGIVLGFGSFGVGLGRFGVDTRRFDPKHFSMRHTIGLVLILSIVVLVFSAGLGIGVGDSLKAGHPRESFYLSVPRVSVLDASDQQLIGQCGLFLGEGDGNDLFYSNTSGVVYFLPVQTTTLTETLQNTC